VMLIGLFSEERKKTADNIKSKRQSHRIRFIQQCGIVFEHSCDEWHNSDRVTALQVHNVDQSHSVMNDGLTMNCFFSVSISNVACLRCETEQTEKQGHL
jgi:hypothetical protein